MITSDYRTKAIIPEELQDLKAIADVEISNITLEDNPNLLVFPDSFESYDRDFGKKMVCNIVNDGNTLLTNSIVGLLEEIKHNCLFIPDSPMMGMKTTFTLYAS